MGRTLSQCPACLEENFQGYCEEDRCSIAPCRSRQVASGKGWRRERKHNIVIEPKYKIWKIELKASCMPCGVTWTLDRWVELKPQGSDGGWSELSIMADEWLTPDGKLST
jgi:hypothetical protein